VEYAVPGKAAPSRNHLKMPCPVFKPGMFLRAKITHYDQVARWSSNARALKEAAFLVCRRRAPRVHSLAPSLP